MTQYVVSSENFSKFDMSTVKQFDDISVRIDSNDPTTEIASLEVVECEGCNTLVHTEWYFSPTEFATITMKQSLTLYVKRKVIEMYPDEYTSDDPRVHSYVSRLSYEGIKFVANNIKEFGEQFHSGRITMKIPKNKYNDKRR